MCNNRLNVIDIEEFSILLGKPIVNGGNWLRSSVNIKIVSKQAKLFSWMVLNPAHVLLNIHRLCMNYVIAEFLFG